MSEKEKKKKKKKKKKNKLNVEYISVFILYCFLVFY
jgi:hypothetical protein